MLCSHQFFNSTEIRYYSSFYKKIFSPHWFLWDSWVGWPSHSILMVRKLPMMSFVFVLPNLLYLLLHHLLFFDVYQSTIPLLPLSPFKKVELVSPLRHGLQSNMDHSVSLDYLSYSPSCLWALQKFTCSVLSLPKMEAFPKPKGSLHAWNHNFPWSWKICGFQLHCNFSFFLGDHFCSHIQKTHTPYNNHLIFIIYFF